jgi:hypothetical protein
MSDKWQAIKVGLIKEKKEQFKDGEWNNFKWL